MPRFSVFVLILLFPASIMAQNGLYETALKGKGQKTTDRNGFQIVVTPKKIEYKKAWIFSEVNDNSRFSAYFRTAKRKTGGSWPVLRIDTVFFHPSSIGSDDVLSDIGFTLTESEAVFMADKMNIPMCRRKDPGYLPEGDFIPIKKEYFTGDTVRIYFVLTNRGKETFTYNRGGRYRNSTGRCNYFHFQITFQDSLLKDISDYNDFGGIEGIPELLPGQSDTLHESVSNWCRFDKPGVYTLDCSYELLLQKPHQFGSFEENMQYACDQWNTEVRKTIRIEIKSR